MVVGDVEVELVLGVFGVYGGASAEHLAEAVGYGVFRLEGGIVGMGEYLARAGRVYHKGTVHVEDLLPRQAVNLVVELVGAVGFEFGEGFQYRQGGTAAVVGTVEQAHVACEGYRSCEQLYVFGSHFLQLLGEDLFEAHHRLGYHLELLALDRGLWQVFSAGTFYYHCLLFFVLLVFLKRRNFFAVMDTRSLQLL